MIVGYRIGDQVYDSADVVTVRDAVPGAEPGGLPRIVQAATVGAPW